ncbi:MAG: hypothetical protein SCARUB_01161 [Candidatus Scalindua rubra]|uniref:NACHT domain-containing protein n=1 Tax=Candidatus Scalindua rubra TaxID=1872076 RepID=A0A1E3XFK8_9BACT|nr:MAG: hypothetical protein SCARUB_01161 [Candidatus Scalindua rubra]
MPSNQLEIIKCRTIDDASQIIEGYIPELEKFLEKVCNDVNMEFNKRNFSDGTFALDDLYISLKTIEKRRWDKYEALMQEQRAHEVGNSDIDKTGQIYEQMDHDKLKEYEKEKEVIIDADRALRNHKRMVILGNPGEGKTTLLYHYVQLMATKSLDKLRDHALPTSLDIPLFAKLPHISIDLPKVLNEDKSLINVVMTIAEVPEKLESFIKEQYEKGRVNLFMDALDEANREDLDTNGKLRRHLLKGYLRTVQW